MEILICFGTRPEYLKNIVTLTVKNSMIIQYPIILKKKNNNNIKNNYL